MTLQGTLRKYLGWCPRFTLPSPYLMNVTKLSTGGKIGIVSILIAWGFDSLVQGLWYLQRNIPGRFELLGNLVIARAFFSQIMVFPFGLFLTILVADYIITGKVIFRHKIELLISVLFGVLIRIVRPLFDIAIWLQSGLSWTRLAVWISWPQNVVDALIVNGYIIILVILCAYLAKRVLTDRSILTKSMIFLLGVHYLWVSFEMLWSVVIQPSFDPLGSFFARDWVTQSVVILGIGANLIFGAFLLRVFSKLRHVDQIEVSAPLYMRGFFLFYGAFSIIYKTVSYSSYSGNAWYYPLATAASIIAGLAIVLITVYSPVLTIGEDSTNGNVVSQYVRKESHAVKKI
jgi:hypothetical protein